MPVSTKSKRQKSLPFYKRASKLRIGIFAVVFAAIGGYIIFRSFAYSRVSVNRPAVAIISAGSASKYWIVTDDGGVFSEGGATFYGSHGGSPLVQPINSAAARPQSDGYWMQGGDCGVFAYGGAKYFGHYSQTATNFCRAIVSTPSGNGYWQISQYGHIFEYGDAASYSDGINNSIKANNTGGFGIINGLPSEGIVAAARTASGKGLILLSANGSTYAYGDAPYHGNAPVNYPSNKASSIAADSNDGYVVTARDGSVYALGGKYRGGANTIGVLQGPVISVAMTPDSGGYWELGQDGGIFTYGDAQFGGNVSAPTFKACWNGTQVLSTQSCPPQLLCWDKTTYVTDLKLCPPQPAPTSFSGGTSGGSGGSSGGTDSSSGTYTAAQAAAQLQAIAQWQKAVANNFPCGSFGVSCPPTQQQQLAGGFGCGSFGVSCTNLFSEQPSANITLPTVIWRR